VEFSLFTIYIEETLSEPQNESTLMSDYLDQLNSVQRDAVTTIHGPVMVIAGPGSGKTRVLTYRIAHLIEQQVPPWEILALTFTNKAAREMQERIESVVGPRANRVWAGTFHSLFARILRIEAPQIGYPSNFTIYDTDDTKSVLSAIVRELNLNKDAYNINTLRSRISSAKSNLYSPRAYRMDEVLMQEDRRANRPRFIEVYEAYTARNKRSGAMDFDDLLFRLYELFQNHPDVLAKYQSRFSHIMVDEFQDTNVLQYAILRKLVQFQGSQKNICIVGDDAQSIYAFRGATIENILSFQKDFPRASVFKLEQNYRSTNHIIEAANQVIIRNKKQIPKKIWSEKGSGQKIQVIRAISDTEEGKRVADSILEQKNRFHLKNNDIAILYRTNAQSRIFEEHLRRLNINYKVFGGMSFYQRKEIKDLLAYLRLAVNSSDEEALRRIINYPKRGIGNTTVAKIAELASRTNRSMSECLLEVELPAAASGKIRQFDQMIHSFRKKAEEEDAYEATKYIAEKSGLLAAMKSDNSIEGLGRLENFNALLDGIQEFVEDDVMQGDEVEGGKSLAAYLQGIALMTDFDQSSDADKDHVTLMSAHSAKGLEFPSVFLVGLEEKLFPSWLSLDSPEGIDEERRLFYVVITRAQRHLTLSFASSRYRFGKMTYNQPSRFLDEIGVDHLDGALPRRSETQTEARSSVSGAFRPVRTRQMKAPEVDMTNFKVSAPEEIQTGMRVLHMKFGEGKVLQVDGDNQSRVATIFFRELGDDSEKRIMLRFAKLQILN